jgi:hypothetical protein
MERKKGQFMPMRLGNSRTRGLTVVEIVIMLAVLAVVGALTFPKFRTMLYASREGRTKTGLGDLRGAISIYYSDNFGVYPADDGTPDARLAQYIVPAYIKAMPKVELKHLHPGELTTVQDRFTDAGDWMYEVLNGFVAVNCGHTDTKGQTISDW